MAVGEAIFTLRYLSPLATARGFSWGLYKKVTVFGLLGFLDRRNEAFRQVLRCRVDLQNTHLRATALVLFRLRWFGHGVYFLPGRTVE